MVTEPTSELVARARDFEFRIELCLDCTDAFLLSDKVASPAQRMVMTTDPPGGVNLRLLETKLMTTWRILCWSPYRIISFKRPSPKGPRSPSSFGRPLSSIFASYGPSKFTRRLMSPSFACRSKMARIWELMSRSRNSFSSKVSCWPT